MLKLSYSSLQKREDRPRWSTGGVRPGADVRAEGGRLDVRRDERQDLAADGGRGLRARRDRRRGQKDTAQLVLVNSGCVGCISLKKLLIVTCNLNSASSTDRLSAVDAIPKV